MAKDNAITLASFSQQEIDNEQWLPIPGYEGWYEASDLGRVRRIIGYAGLTKTTAPRILKQQPLDGYRMVTLTRLSNRKQFRVHRLVIYAFVGVVPDSVVIHHINNIHSDNRLSNLECVTREENTAYFWDDVVNAKGRDKPTRAYKLTEPDVLNIRTCAASGDSHLEIAKRHNVTPGTIANIVYRRSWKHVK